MANSLMQIVSDGSLSTIPLTIKFFEQSHIKVFVNNVELPDGTYTFAWAGATTLTITPAVALGAEVSIRRRTPADEVIHDFQAGAVFSEVSIDENFRQELFLLQEASEQSLVTDLFDDLDMHGHRVYNAGVPVEPRDYTTKQWVEQQITELNADYGLRQDLQVSNSAAPVGSLVYHPLTSNPIYVAPDVEMVGPGNYTTNAGVFKSDVLRFNPAKTTIFYCPDDYARAASGINYPAPFLGGFERPARSQVISAGSKLDDESRKVRRNVVFGPLIGADPIDWNLVDAFGSNPMAYAGRTERTTAIGSEVMVWFGAPDQNWLRTYQHDWWRKPEGMPFEPGEAGWNSDGLETLFPGIGARIAAFTDYATTTAEAGFCYGAGRDALNRIVKGKRNIASGYGAAQNLFVGSYNVDYGALAGCNAVFSSYCTRIGDQAGMNSNDTEYLVSVGYASGRELQDSTGATTVGAFAAADVLSAKKAVVIGNNAGRGHPVPLDDYLVISNAPSAARAPLMAGNFPAALAGINVMPEGVRAKWHVKNSSSGSSISHAGGVLSEGTGTAYFVAETTATGEGQYRFGDPYSGSAGMIAYSHASNSMTFRVNDTNQLRIENNVLRPWETNTMLCGRAAYAFSGGFTQAAFTVTSDERHKTKPIEVSDAILDAWDEVEWLQYKFLDRVSTKGEDARWHFGVIAQRVHEAFKRHGIDGFELGLLCYDKWESEPAVYRDLTQDDIDSGAYPSVQTRILVTPELEAGDKWGIVYEEALALEAKLQRRKYERLLARVEALESK